MVVKRLGYLVCAVALFMSMQLNAFAEYVNNPPYSHTEGNGVSVSDVETVEPGGTMSVTIAYKFGELGWTNGAANSDMLDNWWEVENPLRMFAQEWITNWITSLNVRIVYKEAYSKSTGGKSVTSPVQTVTYGGVQAIIEKDANGIVVNNGYVTFDITIKSDAKDGTYYIPVVFYGEANFDETKDSANIEYFQNGYKTSAVYRIPITVKKEEESDEDGGGGGSYGGGGGGGGVEKQLPVPKLIIDKVDSDPKQPKAGEAFDIILTLRNTSEDLYLQNIQLTYETEEDAVLPISGSSSAFIDKIEKGSTHDVILSVKAKADLEDKPIKLNITLDFEDEKLVPLNIQTNAVLNIEQPQRTKITDPVYPTGAVYPYEPYEVSIKVINMGKSLIYNLEARIVPDSENLLPGESSYQGNVDPATEKEITLEVTALEPGPYSPTIEITYEKADGTPATPIVKALTMYIDEEIEIEEDPDNYPQPTEEPEPIALTVMKVLPWWIYAGLAGVLTLLIISMGIGARRRKKRALYDDEMD